MNEKKPSLPGSEFSDRDVDQLAFAFGSLLTADKKAHFIQTLKNERATFCIQQDKPEEGRSRKAMERE